MMGRRKIDDKVEKYQNGETVKNGAVFFLDEEIKQEKDWAKFHDGDNRQGEPGQKVLLLSGKAIQKNKP